MARRRRTTREAELPLELDPEPRGQKMVCASWAAASYANAAQQQLQDGEQPENEFPVREACVYLCMTSPLNEDVRHTKKDYLGLSHNVFQAWQKHFGGADIDVWPVLVVGGFSRDAGKARALATAFVRLWLDPRKPVPASRALKQVAEHRNAGERLTLREWQEAFDGEAEPVCPAGSCWGERVHTLALLLQHPMWHERFLRVYCFHPSFGQCLERAATRARRVAHGFRKPARDAVSYFTFYNPHE